MRRRKCIGNSWNTVVGCYTDVLQLQMHVHAVMTMALFRHLNCIRGHRGTPLMTDIGQVGTYTRLALKIPPMPHAQSFLEQPLHPRGKDHFGSHGVVLGVHTVEQHHSKTNNTSNNRLLPQVIQVELQQVLDQQRTIQMKTPGHR